MTAWPVFLGAWQIECCGNPPSVGDRVEWNLTWCSAAEVALPTTVFVTREMVSKPVPSEFEVEGRLLQSGQLIAWCSSSGERGDDVGVTLTGVLGEEHHGMTPEALGRTCGVVRSVQVIRQVYERPRDGGADWLPIADEASLRYVHTSPKWFDHALPIVVGQRRRTIETGVLVQLEVAE